MLIIYMAVIPSPSFCKLQHAVPASRQYTPSSHNVPASFTTYRTEVSEGSKVLPVTCRPFVVDRNKLLSPNIVLFVI